MHISYTEKNALTIIIAVFHKCMEKYEGSNEKYS